MDTIDIILIGILIAIIIFFIYNYMRKDKDTDTVESIKKCSMNNLMIKKNNLNSKMKINNPNPNNSTLVNPNFIEVQFHNDYRDTLTAFNNISPSQKQIFNQANVPAKMTNPPISEVKNMVSDFITELNNNITNVVTEHRDNNTGWDEAVPDANVKSGWDKQMEKLGVPTSLYNKPVNKELVKLIKIDHVEKHETEDEIKYTCYLILQKMSVKDQLLIKVSFVMKKNNMDERNFFKDVAELDISYGADKDDKNINLVIEEIFVLGYLTTKQVNEAAKHRDDFYNFSGMENTEYIDQKTIMKELMKKYKQRTRENNSFNATLDEEGRNYHRDLPHLRNYKSYQGTQTIFDDWTNEVKYS